MKNTTRRMTALMIAVLILAMAPCAYADSRGSDSWLSFTYGGYVLIPSGFECMYSDACSDGGVSYSYYNWQLDMWISLTEDCSREYSEHTSTVIDNTYSYYLNTEPNVVNKYKSDHSLALSGYCGNSIYYIQHVIDHGTLYTLDISYPTDNRRSCDPLVDRITGSFSTTGSQRSSGSSSYCGAPGPADLDRIHANINYPNSSSMYLDRYVTATVTHRAVYCFRDPDRDIWRQGNYYTVYYGTEVTILAVSDGYACVIINSTNDAGWINMDYLSY